MATLTLDILLFDDAPDACLCHHVPPALCTLLTVVEAGIPVHHGNLQFVL
jgi:hypothetical protein